VATRDFRYSKMNARTTMDYECITTHITRCLKTGEPLTSITNHRQPFPRYIIRASCSTGSKNFDGTFEMNDGIVGWPMEATVTQGQNFIYFDEIGRTCNVRQFIISGRALSNSLILIRKSVNEFRRLYQKKILGGTPP